MSVDSKGAVFGTTELGNKYPGTNCFGFNTGCGTLFRFSGGAYKVLHDFCEAGTVSCADGGAPNTDPLLIDSAGMIFGETLGGGLHSGGVVFEYVP